MIGSSGSGDGSSCENDHCVGSGDGSDERERRWQCSSMKARMAGCSDSKREEIAVLAGVAVVSSGPFYRPSYNTSHRSQIAQPRCFADFCA